MAHPPADRELSTARKDIKCGGKGAGERARRWPACLSRSVVLLLCVGFFKEMKPSEPFLTPYLVNDKHISNAAVNDQIYPVWTYSYLGMLVLVLFTTDLLRYAPIVLLEVLAFLATRILLLWATGVEAMQLMQFAYGTATAADIAFASVIYVLCAPSRYSRITALAKATVLASQTLSGTLAQLLVSCAGASLLTLNCISFASVSVSVVLALFFVHRVRTSDFEGWGDPLARQEPGVDGGNKGNDSGGGTSEMAAVVCGGQEEFGGGGGSGGGGGGGGFDSGCRSGGGGSEDECGDGRIALPSSASRLTEPLLPQCALSDPDSPPWPPPPPPDPRPRPRQLRRPPPWSRALWVSHIHTLWETCRRCYADAACRRWCVWWVLATCVNLQVENYIQTLWEELAPARSGKDAYNGGVTAASTCVGIVAALVAGVLRVEQSSRGELLLAGLSMVNAVALFIAARADSVWTAYTMYVVFAATFTLLITVVSAALARALASLCGRHNSNFAFVFGMNMFFALALQAILTSIVNTRLAVPVRAQFVIYGALFAGIAVLFVLFVSWQSLRDLFRSRLRVSK